MGSAQAHCYPKISLDGRVVAEERPAQERSEPAPGPGVAVSAPSGKGKGNERNPDEYHIPGGKHEVETRNDSRGGCSRIYSHV